MEMKTGYFDFDREKQGKEQITYYGMPAYIEEEYEGGYLRIVTEEGGIARDWRKNLAKAAAWKED